MNTNAAMILAGLLIALAQSAGAQWSGEGELGMQFARGNSDTETLNTSLKLDYEKEQWANQFRSSFVFGRESGTTNANRFVTSNKTNYKFDETSYVFAVLRYDRDEFSSFTFQSSLSLGYGRRLIDTERRQFKLEIGPGLRYSEQRATGKSDAEAIARGFSEFAWKISDSTQLTNDTLIEAGSDNTFFENSLGLDVAINASLALRVGISLRHNTEVDPGRKKTDTLSTANIVYKFGH